MVGADLKHAGSREQAGIAETRTAHGLESDLIRIGLLEINRKLVYWIDQSLD